MQRCKFNDFVVLKSVERVYSFEFILFHIEERGNIYLKYLTDRSLPFPGVSIRIRACVSLMSHLSSRAIYPSVEAKCTLGASY